MKIDALQIRNFRGIQKLEASDLGNTIIVAGQNGSGKSCIFDAIRLLKSTYGGYQQNEYQQFFGEFQIQLQGGLKGMQGLFNDSSKEVYIEAHFKLRDREKIYIQEHAAELLEEVIWQMLLPEAFQYGGYRKALFAAQFRDRKVEVTQRVQSQLPDLLSQLVQEKIQSAIRIAPSGEIQLATSNLLNLIFSTYRPREIGVIDYHGPQGHYGRELVQGVNLNLDQAGIQQRQHAIFNYNNKYNNVKSEMASNFIRELLSEQAGPAPSKENDSLTNTLKELFESFFPDKKFLGPQPTTDGSLAFPVETQNGQRHDLDELSSGEKEILYGYLRIRSSAPRDSIILLDEPELHLNPRLIRGLPEFYRKHLGDALENQLWLVTHSDALIREAVGKPGFNVFHMLPCGTEDANASQLKPLLVSEDLELVLADLVGDLAAYRPGGKGLIFEGGGDSDFDKNFVGTLFAEELKGINLIPGTNKARVKLLHEILMSAYSRGDLPTKFFAIVDRDTDSEQSSPAIGRFEWNVYHIENYLLEPRILSAALNSLSLSKRYDENSVLAKLNKAARSAVGKVLSHKMRTYVNSKLVGAINLGFNPNTSDLAEEIHSAVVNSAHRINNAVQTDLSQQTLLEIEAQFRSEIQHSLSGDGWIRDIPGREILRKFVTQEGLPISYEILRNMIISRMHEEGFKPAGMKVIIDQICSA